VEPERGAKLVGPLHALLADVPLPVEPGPRYVALDQLALEALAVRGRPGQALQLCPGLVGDREEVAVPVGCGEAPEEQRVLEVRAVPEDGVGRAVDRFVEELAERR